jgi:TonB family protein
MVPPEVTYRTDPPPSHYPRTDSASALLNILIDEKGKVLDPNVTKSSGSRDFDHDASVAVSKWRFKPATCDGKPFPVHIAVQLNSQVKH